MSEFSIDLCVGWGRVGELVEGNFDGITRNLAKGEWLMTGMTAGLTFEPGYDITDIDTVRVIRDTTIVFAGYVAPVASGISGLKLTSTAAGEQYELSGTDAWTVPASRVAWPTPATLPPWADGWDARTGLASAVAAGYVLSNAGNLARTERQISGLTVVDGSAGMSGSWSARLQPLDELVIRVCRDGGIVCRMTVAFSGALQMSLGAPRDRRTTTVLSDQGDLTNIVRQVIPATANFVIAGGQGELALRTFATSGTATGATRRESFSNQSSLATSTEVQQAADTAVALGTAIQTVTAEVTDYAAGRVQYLVDYDIGDIVAIEVADVRYPVVVEAVKVHVSADRAVIIPVFGNAAPNPVTGILRDINDLQSRFDTQIA